MAEKKKANEMHRSSTTYGSDTHTSVIYNYMTNTITITTARYLVLLFNISSTLRLITAAVAIYVMIINDAMTKRWRWQTEMCGNKKIDAQSRAE